MQTTRALTIIALLTGFLVACGDMPTLSTSEAGPRYDTGGGLGTGGSAVAPPDTVATATFGTSELLAEDDGEDETGGGLGTGGD
jgi:hypothetical protein